MTLIQSTRSRPRSHVLHGPAENPEIQHLAPNRTVTESHLLASVRQQTPNRMAFCCLQRRSAAAFPNNTRGPPGLVTKSVGRTVRGGVPLGPTAGGGQSTSHKWPILMISSWTSFAIGYKLCLTRWINWYHA